jgi:hypothetical protein
MSVALLNFIPETVPVEGDTMKIREDGRDKSGRKRYVVTAAVWNPARQYSDTIRRVAIGSHDLARKIAEVEALSGAGSSLKVTFEKCVDNAVKENGGAGMKSVYDIIKSKLGAYRVDRSFSFRFQQFIGGLRDAGKSENTIANYKSCIRHALKKAWTENLINEIPIRDLESAGGSGRGFGLRMNGCGFTTKSTRILIYIGCSIFRKKIRFGKWTLLI